MNEFSCKALLMDLYTRYGRSMPFPGNSNFNEWQKAARIKISELMKTVGTPKIPHLGTVFETRIVEDKYVREHVVLRTAPELWMTAFILYKRDAPAKKDTLIILPEDGAGKFEEVWADDYECVSAADVEKRKRIERNRTFAFEMADQNYLCVFPDTMGTGERREWPDEGTTTFFKCSHRIDNNVAIALGESLGGLIALETSRLCDYIESRNDSTSSIYVGGTGSGAIMAILSALVDDRIEGVYVRSPLLSIKDSALETLSCCSCTTIPKLWQYFDNCDLAAMLAPKKLILSAKQKLHDDGTLEVIRQAYNEKGAISKLGFYDFQ